MKRYTLASIFSIAQGFNQQKENQAMKHYTRNILLSLSTLVVGWLLTVIAPAHADLYLNSDSTNSLLRYDNNGNYFETLVDLPNSQGGGFVGLKFGPDGALYIVRDYAKVILRYDLTTRTLTEFVSSALTAPHEFTFGGPDNDLFVANLDTGSVQRFDGRTGAFKHTVTSVPGNAVSVAADGQGNFYISARGGDIYKYDGTTLTTFASGVDAEAVYLLPDNNLYVGTHADTILRYKLDGTPWGAGGNTTDPTFASGGGLTYPTGITSGPDGHLYVSSYLSNNVLS